MARLVATGDRSEAAVTQAQDQAWQVNKDKLNWTYCTWTNLAHAGVIMVIMVIMVIIIMMMRSLQGDS